MSLTHPQLSSRSTAKSMVHTALFVTLIAIGAFIRIPLPVCPFTLQLLFTTLAGLLLGPIQGALTVLLYVALGLAGLPVFTAGGGPAYVFQPTFGYLLGFIAGSWVAGSIAGPLARWTRKRVLAAVYANLAVVYAFGIAYTYIALHYYVHAETGLWTLFLYAFFLEIPGDTLVCALAYYMARRLRAMPYFY